MPSASISAPPPPPTHHLPIPDQQTFLYPIPNSAALYLFLHSLLLMLPPPIHTLHGTVNALSQQQATPVRFFPKTGALISPLSVSGTHTLLFIETVIHNSNAYGISRSAMQPPLFLVSARGFRSSYSRAVH